MAPTVAIRIENDTGLDLDGVRVVLPGGDTLDYGAVAKAGVTEFQEATSAYRYAEVHAGAGDRDLSFRPVDYLGERPLPAGRYSYVLGLDGGQLVIRLKPAD